MSSNISPPNKVLPHTPDMRPNPKQTSRWKAMRQKIASKLTPRVVLVITTIVILVIVALLIIFLKKRRDNSPNVFDLFGDNFDIRDLPQLADHPSITQSNHNNRGRRENIDSDYRTYNPCLFTLQGENAPFMVYRVCNFSLCPGGKNPWEEHFREKTHSYTYIEGPNGQLFKVKHGSISQSKCEQGCEDARSFVCGDRLYLVCNSTAGEGCRRQMVMMELDLHQFAVSSSSQVPDNETRKEERKKTLPVMEIRPLSLRRLNLGIDNHRDQKNWMPLVIDDKIHFIYSVNPHIVVRYNGPLQDRNNGFDVDDKIEEVINCEKIAETHNPNIPDNLRGGGQIIRVRKWNRVFNAGVRTGKPRYVPEDLYLGIIHSRDSNFEYSTYFYAFETHQPFRVKYLSKGFVFGERTSHSKRIQFASGLVRILQKSDDGKEIGYLHVTYGEHDCHAKVCVIKEEDVLRALIRV